MSDFLIPRFNLQLFADGGASAGASASGEGGTQSGASQGDPYSALNVPDKAKHILDLMPKAEVNSTEGKPKNTEPTSTEEPQTTEEEPPKRKTFEEIYKSEEYAKEGQEFFDKLMGKRLAKYKGVEAQNEAMRGLLDKVNMRYGVNAESSTFLDDLSKAIDSDTKLYEDEAMASGMSVENFMKVKNAEQVMKQNELFQKNRQREEMTRAHVSNLINQAEAFKAQFPSFDLETEINNPQFKKLVDPPELGGSGLSVENAYHALHHKEIMQATLQNAVNQAVVNTSNSIQANRERPQESGAKSGRMSDVTKTDPSKFSLEDFQKIKEEYRRTGKRPKF